MINMSTKNIFKSSKYKVTIREKRFIVKIQLKNFFFLNVSYSCQYGLKVKVGGARHFYISKLMIGHLNL